MREGLAIVVTPAYWNLARVGWLRRVSGDEWELVGARTLRTIGKYVPFAEVAEKGPGKNLELNAAAAEPEPVHRLMMLRVVYCNLDVWTKHVPKPEGWDARERAA